MSGHLLLIGFLVLNLGTFIFFARRGHKPMDLFRMVIHGVSETKIIFAVIAFMGAAISIWMASGIVPALVSYGLVYLNGPNFILVSFFLTVLVASFMGTAVGTVSTIGIALIAIGSSLGADKFLLMGAIVSAAFVADRVSPVSSLTNLTLKITGVEYRSYLKSILKTLLPSLVVSGILLYFMSSRSQVISNPGMVDAFREKIDSVFLISPFLLLVPLAIIVMAAMGVKVLENLAMGTAIGCVISLFLQKVEPLYLLKSIFFGYVLESPLPELNGIFHGGGILPMLEVIIIVMSAIAFSSMLEGTKVVEPIIQKILGSSDSPYYISGVTGLMSMGLTALTCDQTVGILFMGKYMRQPFEKAGLQNVHLARLIADSGTTVAPLIPWNVNALIILAFTGVSVTSFMPFMVLCYVTPIVTLAVLWIGAHKRRSKKISQL